MAVSKLTAERVRFLFDYDACTGVLTNRLARHVSPAGKAIGHVTHQGYLAATIEGEWHQVHRIVWLWVTGSWPTHEVDHLDGVKSNNAWANLRDIPHANNVQNVRRAYSGKRSGLPLGVHPRDTQSGQTKYRALLQVAGRRVDLGQFDTPEAAHAAYLFAKREMHAACTV